MRTALYERHVGLGAKFVDFSGWEMPVHYAQGILHEHRVVRQAVGIFDVSHMGRISIQGADAEFFLDYLSTNQIVGKDDGTATYTVWCSEKGTSVDDLLVFRSTSEDCFIVANAANRSKDLEHLQRMSANYNVRITPRYGEEGILAIQGPNALHVISRLFPKAAGVKYMHFIKFIKDDAELILSRTGYTGSPGYEIYGPASVIADLWDRFLIEGREFGIEPIGLGARDTLRLEMGYALYGHELSDSIAPTESVSWWTVKWGKLDFLGKQALKLRSLQPFKRSSYGILMQDKAIPRQGHKIWHEGKQIGEVTSGTYSPTLNVGIGLILVNAKLPVDQLLGVMIREHLIPAKVVALPFVNVSPQS